MSTGAIIYVAGDEMTDWDPDKEAQFRQRIRDFDRIRIISSHATSLMLHCMWLDLIAQGMTEVVIGKAEFDEIGRVRFIQLYCRLTVTTLN